MQVFSKAGLEPSVVVRVATWFQARALDGLHILSSVFGLYGLDSWSFHRNP